MKVEDFFYHLPGELIAQVPAARRDSSRLMVLERKSGRIEHRLFSQIEDYLGPSYFLVVNDTRVIRARLLATKSTGGRAEVLLLNAEAADNGALPRCLIKGAGVRPGTRLTFSQEVKAEVVAQEGNGVFELRFEPAGCLKALMEQEGLMPLPPYIIRRNPKEYNALDGERYQTVYATRNGAVAAPTAGLHFTPELLSRLEKKGVGLAKLTLHVSYGSFFPLRTPRVEDHCLPGEWMAVSPQAAEAINQARAQGKRIVATGTTTVRALESAIDSSGRIQPTRGYSDLYIYPGYRFKGLDALITNFHLPRSSLLLLVCAFAGRELILAAYQEAIKQRYRFYSYGDAMLIL